MTYFFTQLKNDEERWKFIENYFLGILDDQMEQIKQEISELR
jgi:hypothetical protein